jgi:hypothetical protein
VGVAGPGRTSSAAFESPSRLDQSQSYQIGSSPHHKATILRQPAKTVLLPQVGTPAKLNGDKSRRAWGRALFYGRSG